MVVYDSLAWNILVFSDVIHFEVVLFVHFTVSVKVTVTSAVYLGVKGRVLRKFGPSFCHRCVVEG